MNNVFESVSKSRGLIELGSRYFKFIASTRSLEIPVANLTVMRHLQELSLVLQKDLILKNP